LGTLTEPDQITQWFAAIADPSRRWVLDRLDQATRAMAELAAQWDRRLNAIKRLAETAHAGNKENEEHAENRRRPPPTCHR
jgi:hypothetical protein